MASEILQIAEDKLMRQQIVASAPAPAPTLESLAQRVGDLEEQLRRLIPSMKEKSWLAVKDYDAGAIIQAVAEHFQVPVTAIMGKSRLQSIVRARYVAMHLVRQILGWKYTEIARVFRRCDHGTVLHGMERIKIDMEQDPSFYNLIIALRHRIGEGFGKEKAA